MKGLQLEDGYVSLSDELASFTSIYGNIPITDEPYIYALRKLISALRDYRSDGKTCTYSASRDQPFCACAFELACLLDCPGDTLQDKEKFKMTIFMLSQHEDPDIKREATYIIEYRNWNKLLLGLK